MKSWLKDCLFILGIFIILNIIYFLLLETFFYIPFMLLLLVISILIYYGIKRAIRIDIKNYLGVCLGFGLLWGYSVYQIDIRIITKITAWLFLTSLSAFIGTFFKSKKK